MTELFQNSLLTANEDLQPAPILDELGHELPATDSSTSPTLEYCDFMETPRPIPMATDTTNPAAVNVESGPAESVDGPQPNESTPQKPLPPPLDDESEAVALIAQMKRIITGCTNLPDNVSALVAFWAISTWFQEAFPVVPCLVITGPAHEAMVILRVLRDLSRAPTLLAGFRRADLKDLTGCRTLLISEPNLDNRTASLLGNLTNRDFILVEQGSYLYSTGSKAVYVGEYPEISRIQHSLCIDAAARVFAKPPDPGWSLPGSIDTLRQCILQYRDSNMEEVRCLTFNPCGLSPEATAMANALGSCLLGATQLQTELVALLRPADQQRIADRSDGDEALVVGAALALCHQDKGEVFVKEIAVQVNRLLADRGETRKLSPEKVGHKLRKAGVFTRRLSQAGNGLILDKATRIHLHEVAAAYRREDSINDNENLLCPLCTQNQLLGDVM